MVVLEPGEAPPLHAHHDTEQVFYVLSGSGELQIGAAPGERFPVGPGDLVRIPRNAASDSLSDRCAAALSKRRLFRRRPAFRGANLGEP